MWGGELGYGRSRKAAGFARALTLIGATTLAGLAFSGTSSRAGDQAEGRLWTSESDRGPQLVVMLNKSRTIRILKPFATALIGAPDIADALPMSDRSLYIQGKKVGTTNLSLFDESQHLISVIGVEVAVDTENLRRKIVVATGNRSIKVVSSNGQVVLTGLANDAVAADHAVSVAKSFAPNVINAITVVKSQQVLLKVRFLEATRDANRQLGINWFNGNASGTRVVNTGQGGFSTNSSNGLTSVLNTVPGNISVAQTAGTLAGAAGAPFGTVIAQLVNRGTTIDVLVTALETQGLVRSLAEPNLMALSGDTASFLAGGEFPVPIAATSANGLVTPTIDYHPYGVRLSFTPTVLANGVINLRIAPEVSELDFSNAVTISGTTIPALIKRDAVTTVELRSGQSFAIAGLLQANVTLNRDQIPWLGSVPVLGTLFSSSGYQKQETDLVIIVTPNLVQPAAPGQRLATPLDERLPANDIDFFLLGKSEVKKDHSDFVARGAGLQGPYGHLIPGDPNSSDPGSSR
jgi:pilus assembly protein CpaC